ncbi:MAG TPA: hypothetical protein VNI83_02065 [Vicinamibacterales bacterium]|nr:hypothetical protein [Vicinamibacterales bacterium]
MNWNTFAVTVTAGILTLADMVGIVVLLSAGVAVPDVLIQLLPVGFGAAIGGAAVASRATN